MTSKRESSKKKRESRVGPQNINCLVTCAYSEYIFQKNYRTCTAPRYSPLVEFMKRFAFPCRSDLTFESHCMYFFCTRLHLCEKIISQMFLVLG